MRIKIKLYCECINSKTFKDISHTLLICEGCNKVKYKKTTTPRSYRHGWDWVSYKDL